MSNLSTIPENTLTIDIDRMPLSFVPDNLKIAVKQEFGNVVMAIGKRSLGMNTITAHSIGMAIVKGLQTIEKHELFVITINGEKIKLLKITAQKLSTALLRKADDADDWQINRRKLS